VAAPPPPVPPALHPHQLVLAQLVERWFAELTNRKLRRSAHRSVVEVERDVRGWINEWNTDPKPFVWTKTANEILDTFVAYCQRINDSRHLRDRACWTRIRSWMPSPSLHW
jgi:hypothetical protein